MRARGIRIRESEGNIPIIPIYTNDVMTTLNVAKAIYDAASMSTRPAPGRAGERLPAAHELYGHPHRGAA